MLLTALLSVLTGCGYRFAGSADNRITAGQTLWVDFIRVEINSPDSAQTVLRRAMLDECHAFRGVVPSGSDVSADLRIRGNLSAYSIRAISFTARDQAKEYRLTIEADLELYRKGESIPVWKGTIQGYRDFPAADNLAFQRSAEEAALSAASRIVAQKFIMAIEQSY